MVILPVLLTSSVISVCVCVCVRVRVRASVCVFNKKVQLFCFHCLAKYCRHIAGFTGKFSYLLVCGLGLREFFGLTGKCSYFAFIV